MTYKDTSSYKYALDVTSGKLLASKYIIAQAKRYLNDLKRKDLYFCMDAHHLITIWFEKIAAVPELKKPVPLAPPHAFWIEQLFCMKYTSNNRRKYKKVYAQFARKQGKTFFAAALALFELVLGSDPYHEIMTGANSKDQAIICTKMMGKIIDVSPILQDLLKEGELQTRKYSGAVHSVMFTTKDENGLVERDGKIIAMPKDPGDGGNPSFTIVDELHEAPTLALLETMETGQMLRPESLTVVITSPGVNKDAPCYTVLRKEAVNILDGVFENDRFLPVMFELDDESEWDDIDMLVKSNPMMPYWEPLRDILIERIAAAKMHGGGTEAIVKIKNCGIWTDAAEVWLQASLLERNNHGITDEELLGKKCYTGLDLAKTDDLNAFVMFFPNVRPGIHVVKPMFWIPEDKVKDNRDHVDYQKWCEQGFMIKQEGNAADHVKIAKDIIKEIAKYELMSFGYDSKYAIMAVLPMMAEAGYELELEAIGQGFVLSPSIVQFTDWINQTQMHLGNNRVLKWNFANTVMKMGEQGDMYPSKVKSGNKIDGVSAMLTAITAYMRTTVEEKPVPLNVVVW